MTMRNRTTRLAIIGSAALLLAGCGAGTANLRDGGGSLQACSSAPHCVSSEASDPKHRVEPLSYRGSPEQAQRTLVGVLKAQDGAKLVEQSPGYVYATFTSAILRFVDDVEFVFDDQTMTIKVRSSSRIGYYDFGANRSRVEKLRSAFNAAATPSG